MRLKLIVVFWILNGVNCYSLKGRRCRNAGHLKNSHHTEDGSYRVYSCEEHFVSNIPGLNKIKFQCKFDWNLGDYVWKATESKSEPHGQQIHLRNVTCELKKQCFDPPLPDNMERKQTSRYQIAVSHREIPEALDNFYSGDTLKYSCFRGYNVQSAIDRFTYGDDGNYGSYDHYYGSTQDETVIDEITCDLKGRWNGFETYDLNFGECRAISCNASRFHDIRNGNITNYKESYGFLEKMELVCDEGYRQKDRINSVTCKSSSSFKEYELPNFGCEPIRCVEPAAPINGHIRLAGLYVGDTALYECEAGFRLIGKSKWTCQLNGKWDNDCVICASDDSYCTPPCVPLGADLTSTENTHDQGAVLEFTCKSRGHFFGGSKNRTCMKNKQWSGSPIDCIGTSLFEPNVGVELLSAVKKIPQENKTQDTNEMDRIMSKTINVGAYAGVDVYFLVDVSRSITEEKFNATKEILFALLPELGINNADFGTRIALTFFAEHTYTVFNQQYLDCELFESYKEAHEVVSSSISKLEEILAKTKSGTAITTALEDITTDIETKQIRYAHGILLRDAQQVLILISDGEYTSMGDPSIEAAKLKQKFGFDIYSIAVSTPESDGRGFKVMQHIASQIDNERHFFKIDSGDENLAEVTRMMINRMNADIPCGMTNPRLTEISVEGARLEQPARKDAWPWMVQLRTENEHVCGGSLINDRWILTAAQCFHRKDISEVHLRKLTLDQRDNYDALFIRDKNIYIHEKYNKEQSPLHLYNIALVKLERKINTTPQVLPVCLWNHKIKNETGNMEYAKFFESEKRYGVVTGWGMSEDGGPMTDTLKQMQMEIKPDNVCEENLDAEQKKEVNGTLMFCAGGKEEIDGEYKIIDTCSGDTGGPFVVRNPLNENKYIQIGIVSFGFGCKKEGKFGFYTKLTEELLTWIEQTIN